MNDAYFFGYGSLVNTLTHGYMPVHKAQAKGWRRAWRATRERKVAYLTAIRDPGCAIDGLIAPVPGNAWATLDLREHAYERLAAAHEVVHGSEAGQIALYAIAPERAHLPTRENPVLLSYIDVVVQGYLTEFGAQGAEHFFATTTGWEAPILDDRAEPIYPRAQRLSAAEQDVVDAGLARLQCRLIAADALSAGA